MKPLFFKILLSSIFISLLVNNKSNAQSSGKEIDTSFNTALNHIFSNLDKTKIPFGLLRDYAMEFTNLENYNGTALTDSNTTDNGILRQIYTTLATARMTSAAAATLPGPNTIDSLWYLARKPGQVTLSGLFYQYAYLASNADSTGKITITNNQLFDKYVNGVWQNPYLQAQTVGFAPATTVYNALNFNLVLPANLWLTNSGSLVSKIQVDAGDGLGYRTITPGTSLPVMYADTGLKVWNFKVFLTNSTVLQSHSQITIRGAINNLTCYTAGCGPYTPPPGGNPHAIFADVISGAYPSYLFSTGATYNGVSANGTVTLQYASTHTSLINPLIVVEGFDERYYTAPEDMGLNDLSDFLKYDVALSSNLLALLNTQYDIVYITFRNGTDDIHRNALLVASVIRWVNANKTGTNKNVVLGLSMGGLCSRYALKTMENAGETHNVGLFICHGTPQQGVVVPLGLQYLENHFNQLYFQSGVNGIYSLIRLFKPSLPDINGVLTLTDAPAAEQMLINRSNDNFQLDNSVHTAWQTELTALGYPAQGGIRNIAISNGSECGQTQPLAQGGQLVLLDGKLSTSVWGDLITEFVAFDLHTLNPGNGSFALGALPGRNTISLHFQANAAADGGGNQVYNGKITYTKTILWLIPVSVTLTNRTFNTPAGILPYETFAGDFYKIPVTPQNLVNSGWFAKYHITFNVAPNFGFVPTPSVLDIGRGSVTLAESDYLLPYTQASPPLSPKNTPFANFITAFSTSPNNNEEHITYETRNGNWLVGELTKLPTIADCTVLCQLNTISGAGVDCNNLATYTVPTFSNVTYSWSVSSNLQIFGAQNKPSLQVQPGPGSNGQQGTITAYLTSGDCGTQTITKTISIGVEPLVVSSTVDRTPQSSHYQYLTATATQLGNTVPANYNWYLEVNGLPTTLIGTGLILNHYPLAPCTTIFYRLQVTTACGLAIDREYAYNTYCNGGMAATNQSVVIYPNPADHSMTVTNNNIPAITDAAGNANGTVPQSYKIVVYNANGSILKKAHNVNGDANITFRTADIPNGNYFLHVIQGANVIEKQIIIQH
jgi:hypothetical protein